MRGKQPSVPPPLMEEMAVDDAEMLEEHYETEGSDYAMGFGNEAPAGEETAIGEAPERPTDPNDYNGGRGGRDDW